MCDLWADPQGHGRKTSITLSLYYEFKLIECLHISRTFSIFSHTIHSKFQEHTTPSLYGTQATSTKKTDTKVERKIKKNFTDKQRRRYARHASQLLKSDRTDRSRKEDQNGERAAINK
jgi:hypothetical protein